MGNIYRIEYEQKESLSHVRNIGFYFKSYEAAVDYLYQKYGVLKKDLSQ